MIGLAIRVKDVTQRREKRPRVISEKTAVKETSNNINQQRILPSLTPRKDCLGNIWL